MIDTLKIFVSCVPGLEDVLASELEKLNLSPVLSEKRPITLSRSGVGDEPGGFLLAGSIEDIYRCNLHLRTASRVSVRLGEFYAAAFSELRKKASHLAWEHYLKPGQPVQISVTCHKSRLYHSDAVAERVLGAINDHFSSTKKQSKADKKGQLVLVRLVNDLCTISIDSTGELLHKRGYRQASAKAPLRETLAAGLLLLSGWQSPTPLLDPFCGSGTIPIEAALIARNIPPGIVRDFAFTSWPVFDPRGWQELLQFARDGITRQPLDIYGYDRDQGAIQAAESNASRAGLKDAIIFNRQAISELKPPEGAPGWIITNPPYGVRVSTNKDLRDLYARFGSLISTSFSYWQAGILSYDKRLAGNLGLPPPRSLHHLTNGGLPVEYRIYAL